jgi:hypothetical protein
LRSEEGRNQGIEFAATGSSFPAFLFSLLKFRSMNKLVHEELTGRIIAGAIEVHKALGPGFLESIYEAAMPVELKRAGLKVESQKPLPVFYREVLVEEHRLDLPWKIRLSSN